MELSINTKTQDGVIRITVIGEVDVSNAASLRSALDGALASKVTSVQIDMAQVGYIDSTGIGVLVGTAHRAAEKGIALVIERPQANVRRVLGLLGVSEELNVRDDA